MQLLQYELNGRLFDACRVPPGTLSRHEEEILRLGAAKAVLPVTVTETAEGTEIAFAHEETELFAVWFRRNRGLWDAQGDRLLRFAMRIVRGLLDAEAHFLPLDLFAIDADRVRIRPRDEEVFLVPDAAVRLAGTPDGTETEGNEALPDASDPARLRTELAAFLKELGSGLGDSAWNRYRKRLLLDLTEETGGLGAVLGVLERARGELYRILPGEGEE